MDLQFNEGGNKIFFFLVCDDVNIYFAVCMFFFIAVIIAFNVVFLNSSSSIAMHSVSLRCILILSSCHGLQIGLFASASPNKIWYAFSISVFCARRPVKISQHFGRTFCL